MTYGYLFHMACWLDLGPQVWSYGLWPKMFGIPKKGATKASTVLKLYDQISCPFPYNISQFLSQPRYNLPVLTCHVDVHDPIATQRGVAAAKGQLALMDQKGTSCANEHFTVEVWHFPFPS